MAANFTYIPTWVKPIAPQYSVEVTPSENFKKERLLVDTNAVQKFELEFKGVSDSDRNAIIAHYKSAYGPYDSFSWTTVPSYLNEGASMTVYYVEGSYREKAKARSWDISLTVEKEVT